MVSDSACTLYLLHCLMGKFSVPELKTGLIKCTSNGTDCDVLDSIIDVILSIYI